MRLPGARGNVPASRTDSVQAGDVCGGQRADLARFQGYYGTVAAPGIERVGGRVRQCHRHRSGHVPRKPWWIRDGGRAEDRARAGEAVGRFGRYFTKSRSSMLANLLCAALIALLQGRFARLSGAQVFCREFWFFVIHGAQ
jgi:hypothetical protein